MDKEFTNRPTWEFTNPQILLNVYAAVNNFQEWKTKYCPQKTSQYALWKTHLAISYMTLSAHMKSDKNSLFVDAEKVMRLERDSLTDLQLENYTYIIVDFIYKLGMTDVRVKLFDPVADFLTAETSKVDDAVGDVDDSWKPEDE